MEIRSLDLPDFEALLGLVEEVYSDAPSAMWFVMKPDAQAFRPIFRAKMEGIVLKDVVDLIALDAGRMVGECEIVRRHGELGMLGIIVSRDKRRIGVASRLLAEASAEALRIGISRIRAEVDERNSSAILFLARRGFSMNGTAARKVGEGEISVMLMLKDIGQEGP